VNALKNWTNPQILILKWLKHISLIFIKREKKWTFTKAPDFFFPSLAGLSWKELATLVKANLESKECVVFLTIVVPWRKG
jgi:hypothetical protein